MRLLHTTTLSVEEVTRLAKPQYAILSHTWDETELSLQDLNSGSSWSKSGYLKVQKSCEKARIRNTWIWIDTCCIDKSSSAELSEAVNSMYRWYEDSDVFYVYLADFEDEEVSVQSMKNCKWFSRGWTLQELLAPSNVIFYNRYWAEIGSKRTLAGIISAITGIPLGVMQGSSPLRCTVAQRFSWAATRETTRSEDIAYCLLGIFDVEMAPIYGEGSTKAFIRLQEQILKRWNDHSIFAWTPSHEPRNTGLLATSPRPFCKHKECFRWAQDFIDLSAEPFDPYEHILPSRHSSYLRIDGDDIVSIAQGLQVDHIGPTPNLGPRGLQISLLLSENANLNYTENMRPPVEQRVEICLDLDLMATIGRHRARIFLPLAFEIYYGFHSQNLSRRGLFYRVPPILGSGAGYGVKSEQVSFRRQTFCVSQIDPVIRSEEGANFTFKALPASAKLLGSFICVPTQNQTTVDITSSFHCTGGSFRFSIRGETVAIHSLLCLVCMVGSRNPGASLLSLHSQTLPTGSWRPLAFAFTNLLSQGALLSKHLRTVPWDVGTWLGCW